MPANAKRGKLPVKGEEPSNHSHSSGNAGCVHCRFDRFATYSALSFRSPCICAGAGECLAEIAPFRDEPVPVRPDL